MWKYNTNVINIELGVEIPHYFLLFRFPILKYFNLAFSVAHLPGVEKPEQNDERNHRSQHQESQVHQPFLWSLLSSEDLGSLGLQEEDCDTDVLNRFRIINEYFSFLSYAEQKEDNTLERKSYLDQ